MCSQKIDEWSLCALLHSIERTRIEKEKISFTKQTLSYQVDSLPLLAYLLQEF